MAARLAALLLATILLSCASVAQAQAETFSLHRYRPAPGPADGFGLLLPDTPGDLEWGGKVVIDYSHGPLVLDETVGDETNELGDVVRHAVVAHLLFALGIGDELQVWAGLPVQIVASGETPPLMAMGFDATDTGGAAMGDASLGGSFRLLGGSGAPPDDGSETRLGISAEILLPTGSQDAFAGDGGVGVRTLLLLSMPSADFVPVANLGVAYRPRHTYVSAELGTELLFGVGGHVPLDGFRLEAELRGAATFADFFGEASTPLEVLVGARFDLGETAFAGVALGAGITGAVGVPDVRAIASFGFASGVGGGGPDDEDDDDDDDDEDGDGFPDDVDACPEEPGQDEGCPGEAGQGANDRDGDGVPNGDDFCPDTAETQNGFQDDDGCPDGIERSDTHLVVTPALLFDEGSDAISDEVEEVLDLVARHINDNADIQLIQVEGHASSDEGRPRQTLRLSEQRADAALRWLITHGVDESRLTAVGVDADQPASQDEPAENRRVELRIVSF